MSKNHPNGICLATTKAGTSCTAPATASGRCYFHTDPEKAAEAGRRGGLKNRYVRPDDENTELPALETAADVRSMLAKVVYWRARSDSRCPGQ